MTIAASISAPPATGERRGELSAVPNSLDLYLNAEQLEALATMEYFGWRLEFVRHSDLNNIVVVIKHQKNAEYAVLDGAGDMIRNPELALRA